MSVVPAQVAHVPSVHALKHPNHSRFKMAVALCLYGPLVSSASANVMLVSQGNGVFAVAQTGLVPQPAGGIVPVELPG